MNREQLKMLAIVAMTCNHAAYALLPAGSVYARILIYLGYFTAPVMCRLLVDGYRYTRSKKKYALRLLITGAAAQLPYMRALGLLQLNFMFTLLVCLLLLMILDAVRDPLGRIAAAAALIGLSTFCDWGGIIPAAAALFYLVGENRKKQIQAYAAVTILHGISQMLVRAESPLFSLTDILAEGLFSMIGPALGGICLYVLYNGRRSERFPRFHKWFFYLYYPAHLAVLALLRLSLS